MKDLHSRALSWITGMTLCLALVVTTGCETLLSGAASPASTTQAPPPPPPVQPYDQAVLSAATALLNNARLPAEGTPPLRRYPVVIDPLIDGMTGNQTATTQSMGVSLAELIKRQYPQLELLEFSAANIARNPLVLIGTFTGVNAQRQTAGMRESYRICFALADLRSGKLVSKGLAFATPQGVDATPTSFFRDAPAWSDDPATTGYIKTCQGTKAGDPINPLYVDRILTAALIADAIEAYDAGRFREALSLYQNARNTPNGNQLRVLNGLYLSNWKLGHDNEAEKAFANLIDYGLEHRSLSIKFLFRPGSTAFVTDARLSGQYPAWLKSVATRTARSTQCLEITGHSSPTGPEPLNERLSQLRADSVRTLLTNTEPALGKRLIAAGAGSRQTLIGTGRDDASDALDRRVEFKVIGC